MKLHIPAALAVLCLLSTYGPAGEPVHQKEAPGAPDPKDTPEREWRSFLPDEPAGNFTLGAEFSKDLSGIYLDGITGLWAPKERDAFLFLNSRYDYEDNGQFIASTGLGFRKLLAGHDVILGANVYWDAINTEHDNDLNQLGLGVELLTRWVDARFNYYLPEDDRFEVGRSSRRSSHSHFVPGGFVRTSEKADFKRFEAGLEGYNAEVGVLIPGLDKYAEVRAYAGFYHYENPFGGDFDGFKARLEARLLQGVIADVEYWDDAELMGGHWTAGIAVSVPFSLYNLFTGKNPFEGAGEAFKPVPRPFRDRMGDMVMRSHRVQTVTSGDIQTGHSSSRKFTPLSTGSSSSGSSSGGGGGFPIE
jgi:hypothetical protein